MGDIVVTREQIKDVIKAEGLKPSDLFDMDSLGSDPTVRGYADDLVKERIGRTWREKKEAEEQLEKLRAQADKEKSELQQQITGLKLNSAKAQLGSLLDKQKAERKLDDRQMKFVQNRLERFAPKNPDDLEKEFATFLDAEVDEYKRLAKDVFGIDGGAEGAGGDKKSTGSEPSGPKEKLVDQPHLDPTRNPYIKIT